MSDTTPLLLIRLEGPLQSWGIRSRWDVRDSQDEPTKSGIIGLLGCTLGYSRNDTCLEELDAALRIGVRVEQPGKPIIDFQTITGKLPTAEGKFKGTENDPWTILSPRTYLQDAAFLVVIGGPIPILRKVHSTLADPHWPVYLGRKCCVATRPVLDCLTSDYASIEDALRRHPWSCQSLELRSQKPPAKLRCTVEDTAGPAIRCDALRINAARMYGFRNVRIFYVTPSVQEEEPSCT